MQAASNTEPVLQRWIICALCSLTFALIAFKNTCFAELYDIVLLCQDREYKTNVTKGTCPMVGEDRLFYHQEMYKLKTPKVLWSPHSIDMADAVFWAGRMVASIPAGIFSDVGYSRIVLPAGMLLSVIQQILLPTLSEIGYRTYLLQNFIEGVCEATIYPSVMVLASRNCPHPEINIFVALILAGTYYGGVMGHLFFNHAILQFKNWSYANYSFSMAGAAWLIIWYGYMYSPMATFPQYKSLSKSRQRIREIPWFQIFTSGPVLSAVFVYCFATKWTDYNHFWFIAVPYQRNILNVPPDLSKDTTFTLVAVLPSSLLAASMSDWLVARGVASTTLVKHAFVFAGVSSSSLLQIFMAQVGCHLVIFWALLVTSVYLTGLALPTIFTTPIHLSRRYAGLLTAIMCGADAMANLFGVRMSIVGFNRLNKNHWQFRMFFSAVLNVLTVTVFLFYGSGDAQDWNNVTRHPTLPPAFHPTTDSSESD